jgi:excinuclease UvrABC nuclease subunit
VIGIAKGNGEVKYDPNSKQQKVIQTIQDEIDGLNR